MAGRGIDCTFSRSFGVAPGVPPSGKVDGFEVEIRFDMQISSTNHESICNHLLPLDVVKVLFSLNRENQAMPSDTMNTFGET